MSRFKVFHMVPGWARALTGAAAIVVAASLPALAGAAPIPAVMAVAAAGLFSASIAIFGRAPEA